MLPIYVIADGICDAHYDADGIYDIYDADGIYDAVIADGIYDAHLMHV